MSGACRIASVALLAAAISGCGGGGQAAPPVPAQASVSPFTVPPHGTLSVPKRPSFIDTVPPKPVTDGSRSTSSSPPHPPFFAGEAALSNGVFYLQLPNGNIFGYYSYLSDPRYIYHFDMGYEFIVDANDGGGMYMYDFASGHWLYTSRTFAFPYLYDFSAGAFIYYFPDTNNPQHYTTNPRYFDNLRTGQIYTSPNASGTSCVSSTGRAVQSLPRTPLADLMPPQRRSFKRGLRGEVPNQLYVSYRSTATAGRAPQSLERSVSALRGVDIASTGGKTLRALTFASGADAAAAAAALRADPSVDRVSPVHYRSLSSDSAAGANDFYFDNKDQWYLYKTNVVKNSGGTGAWNVAMGCSRVAVALIDTGVDLSGNDTNDFLVDFAESVVNGVTTVGNAAAQDTNGHGTNTAGLAVAQANNGYGFAGVGFSIHLQAYRIFPDADSSGDQQSASTADEAKAINDAVAHGASIISLSIGSPASAGADAGEQAAIENAISAGVVVVAANGNDFGDGTTDGDSSEYPAAYPGVIGVGATGVTNTTANVYNSITSETVASYSNSGPTLVAPGGDASSGSDLDFLHWIEGYSTTTAGYPPDQCTNGTGSGVPTCRVLFNGTSQATPQVSGIVALMEAYHGGPKSLAPSTVTAILTSTTDNIGVSAVRQGAGRVNAGRAVAAAHP